jgi:leader peptidase (prepilin peptidase)/N-methyltransferase
MDPRQLETLHAIFFVVSGVVGAMVGSFLNVCVYRMPKGLSIVRPRSACRSARSADPAVLRFTGNTRWSN